MRKIKCPNCGQVVEAGVKFCPNCGHRLPQPQPQQQRQQQPQPQRPQQPQPSRTQQQAPVPPQHNLNVPPRRQQGRKMQNNSHEGMIITLGVIIVILIMGLFAIGAYQNKTWPFGPAPSSVNRSANSNKSSHSQSNSSNANPNSKSTHSAINDNDVITTMWSDVQGNLKNNDSNSIAHFFANGKNNKSFHSLNDWEKMVASADTNNGTKVKTIEANPDKINEKSIGNGKTKLSYPVTYDFIIQSGHGNGNYQHIQIFKWTAIMNSNHKIVKTNSPKKPSKDTKISD